MAKNNNYNKNKNNNKEEKVYKNPAQKTWGKILITILAAAMALSGLASLIYLIIKNILG